MIIDLISLLAIPLILYSYFRVKGYRISFLERLRIAVERNERRKIVRMKVESFKKKEKPILRTFAVLSFVVLLLALAYTHKLFWAVVVSDSMFPTMKRGDIILVQSIYIDPHVGDIIMFRRPDTYLPITHRILRIRGDLIYTGGDASGPDPWVITRKDIIAQAVMIGGKPIVIPGIGKYFILNAQELRSIGPFGEEYLFYKHLIKAFKSYALAIVIICSALYVYLELGRY